MKSFLNFFSFGKPVLFHTIDWLIDRFREAVRIPGLVTSHNVIQEFLPVCCTAERNVKADVVLLFLFICYHFGHPSCPHFMIVHSVPRFRGVMYVKFVENTSITLKLWTACFHEFCCWLFQQGNHSRWLVSHCDLHHARLFGHLCIA
jgi:hypothetical protein